MFLKEWVDPVNETNVVDGVQYITQEWVEGTLKEMNVASDDSCAGNFETREETYKYLARGMEKEQAIQIKGYDALFVDGVATMILHTLNGDLTVTL